MNILNLILQPLASVSILLKSLIGIKFSKSSTTIFSLRILSFADVAKWHMVLLLVSWEKLYFEPDTNNLVISYKVMKNDIAEKTGSMEIKSNFTNKGKRYFQSFKSGISEYLGQYEVNLKLMTKELMNKLTEEL